MPSLDTYKKMLLSKGNTIGEVHKTNSDIVMEATWDRDVQSRKCYIYDVFHDDQPESNSGYDPSQSKLKTPIDAKFIMTQYQTLVKDIIDYHLQFRPSQKVSDFNESDELYYYERDFTKRFSAEFPVGLYVDIEDDKKVYHKWLICQKEYSLQFVKYIILPCNYNFRWITFENGKRILNKMWGVSRNQLSYNSGVYRNDRYEKTENQDKCWLPINSITSELFYTNDDRNNQRLFISAATNHPIVWRISKVENHAPFGLQKLTVVQDYYNSSTDYIDWDAINKGDTYAMYADYFDSSVSPIDLTTQESVPQSTTCTITTSNNRIKVGGSYKTLTAKFYDFGGIEITDQIYSSLSSSPWKAFIDNKEVTNTSLISWKSQDKTNIIKVKFGNDSDYLSKILVIKCEVEYEGDIITGEIELEIVSI